MGQPTTEPGTGATPPAPTDPSTTPPAPPTAAPPGDELGEAGKKALEAERAARKDLEAQVKALEPLKNLAAALGVKPEGGKSDVDTLAATVKEMRDDLASERIARMRLEVAAEKGLTPAQAARLTGATKEDLAKDADALKELFPTAPGSASGTPGTPAPDPSQGSRGGTTALEADLAKAVEAKNVGEQVRLKTAIAAAKAASK